MLKTVGDGLFTVRKKSKTDIVINVILIILILLLVGRMVFYYNFAGIYVVGPSMNPTLHGAETETSSGGDYLFVSRYGKPQRGDIVIVEAGSESRKKAIVKRVIALEGDKVYLNCGKLYIQYADADDFVCVEESYVAAENNVDYIKNTTDIVEVGENEMFVLGDNRDISNDSRYYGCFQMSALYGVVTDWSMKYKSEISALHNFFSFEFLGGAFSFII